MRQSSHMDYERGMYDGLMKAADLIDATGWFAFLPHKLSSAIRYAAEVYKPSTQEARRP